MKVEDVVLEQIQRLRVIWPTLNAKQAITQEIHDSVMRHSAKLTEEDVRKGFDIVIESSPSRGWPPGPHEVIGCILRAAGDRRSGSVIEREKVVPQREVVGRQCTKCGGPVNLLRSERLIHCQSCNVVQVFDGHFRDVRYRLYVDELDKVVVRRAPASVVASSDGDDAIEWGQDG